MDVVVSLAVPVHDWEGLKVPDGYTAEVVGGEIVVSPSGTPDHGYAGARLLVMLANAAPDSVEVVKDLEWVVAKAGIVASAPIPDLMVVSSATAASGGKITETPLLVAEVLSPSDFDPLPNSRVSKIEGKRADYAANGLLDYLELDLLPGRQVLVRRYEYQDGSLVVVDESSSTAIEATRPFGYRLDPSRLLPK